MSYRKHSISKGARRAHHKREKARRKKIKESGKIQHQLDVFGYFDIRGKSKRVLRIMSVTKGPRDGYSKPK